MKLYYYKTLLAFSLLLLLTTFSFAQNETDRGIELYQKGDYQGAIQSLKDGKEVIQLYYLGLSYEKTNESGKAKDAFKKSFMQSYDYFFKNFDEWQKIDGSKSKKSFEELLHRVRTNNEIGYTSAVKAFELKSDILQTNEARIKAKVLLDTVNLAKSQDEIYSFTDKSVSTVRIIEKPRPVYPKDVSGTPILRFKTPEGKGVIITLFMVFGADGKVKLLIPIEELIDAFTVEGINAANKIKFNPAVKEKESVDYHAKVQFSFSIR